MISLVFMTFLEAKLLQPLKLIKGVSVVKQRQIELKIRKSFAIVLKQFVAKLFFCQMMLLLLDFIFISKKLL